MTNTPESPCLKAPAARSQLFPRTGLQPQRLTNMQCAGGTRQAMKKSPSSTSHLSKPAPTGTLAPGIILNLSSLDYSRAKRHRPEPSRDTHLPQLLYRQIRKPIMLVIIPADT